MVAYTRNNNNPANAMPVWDVGNSIFNTAADTAGTQIATGSGTFNGLTVNTAGAGSTATFYDGTSTAGPKLGTFNTTVQSSLQFNWAFAVGLFVVLTGGTPADVTVAYRQVT